MLLILLLLLCDHYDRVSRRGAGRSLLIRRGVCCGSRGAPRGARSGRILPLENLDHGRDALPDSLLRHGGALLEVDDARFGELFDVHLQDELLDGHSLLLEVDLVEEEEVGDLGEGRVLRHASQFIFCLCNSISVSRINDKD